MTRRVLNRIRLDKIAAVDAPCQVPAIAAIIKRAPVKDAPPSMAKKTFQEALNAQLISERISDTFWRAFENQWAVREAFRTALSDEISEGGDGDEAVAGFTAAMQQIATLAAEAAREAATPPSDVDLESAVEQAINKWLETKETDMTKLTTKALLKAAIAKFNPTTTPVVDMIEIQKAAKDLDAEDELPPEGPLAVSKADKTDPEMAKMKRELAILKFAPNIRKHFDTLAADAQDKFLAKSEADQVAEVDAIEKGDPVLYTCEDGTAIRKSDGAVAAMLAKQNDNLAKQVATLTAGSADSAFEKRAKSEFPHVAEAEAVDMLKAADKLGADSAASKSIVKTLTTMNKARSTLFKNLGTTEVEELDGDTDTARTEFNKAVDEVVSRDKIGKSEAMSKVRTDQPALFKRAFPDTTDVAEEAE